MPVGELEPGDKIRVSWGKEHFCPVQYVSFEVGPFEAEVTIREDETAEQAYQRARRFLSRVAREEFDTKSDNFLKRVRIAGDKARNSAG